MRTSQYDPRRDHFGDYCEHFLGARGLYDDLALRTTFIENANITAGQIKEITSGKKDRPKHRRATIDFGAAVNVNLYKKLRSLAGCRPFRAWFASQQ